MAINIKTQNLIPVSRDGQIRVNSGAAFISSNGGGGGGIVIDNSTKLPVFTDASIAFYWEASTNSIRTPFNFYSDGEVGAWTSAPSIPNWQAGLFHESSIGTGFYWLNGLLNASTGSGGGGGVSQAYVDGSLATRDTAISGKLDNNATAVDSDKLDGQHGSYYAPLASPAFTGSGSWDTPTFVLDAINHRIGIGITNPAWKFEVGEPVTGNCFTGVIARATNSTIAGTIFRNKDSSGTACGGAIGATADATGGGLGLGGNTNLGGTSTHMFINSAGKVGIGTFSPDFDLHIGTYKFGLQKGNASPNAGFIRFGDNTGWRMHFGRGRESAGSAVNTDATGVVMTIQDDGKVGIGANPPTSLLHLYSSDPALSIQTSASGNSGSPAHKKISFLAYQGTETGRIDSTNILQESWRSDMVFSTMHSDSVFYEDMRLTDGNLTLGTWKSNASSSAVNYIDTGNSYSNGATGVNCKIYLHKEGTVATNYGFSVGSNADMQYFAGNSSGSHDFYLNDVKKFSIGASGVVSSGESTAYSDKRLKTDIIETQPVLDKLKKVRVVDYKRIDTNSDKVRTGVIAQELQNIFPQYVSGDESEGMLSVNYAEMVSICIKAIQEQQKQINDLKKDLNYFKNYES